MIFELSKLEEWEKREGNARWYRRPWILQLHVPAAPGAEVKLVYTGMDRLDKDEYGRGLPDLWFDHQLAARMLCLYVVYWLNTHELQDHQIGWWWCRFAESVGWRLGNNWVEVTMDDVIKLHGRIVRREVQTQGA